MFYVDQCTSEWAQTCVFSCTLLFFIIELKIIFTIVDRMQEEQIW